MRNKITSLMVKKIIFFTIVFFIIIYSFIFYYKNTYNNTVNIKIILNYTCGECISLKSYLEAYIKSGVKFGDIEEIDYNSSEGNRYLQKYNIQKLPFIIFSKNLERYETIASSWNTTFGYKNDKGEYIPTDIIPPYFNIKTKRVDGLIDLVYIGDLTCKDCYLLSDIKKVLTTFGIRFNNIKSINKDSDIAKYFIKKYNIQKLPTVILSSNLNLYKNFSYFWKSLGTIEEDNKYILRKPYNLGLKTKLNLN